MRIAFSVIFALNCLTMAPTFSSCVLLDQAVDPIMQRGVKRKFKCIENQDNAHAARPVKCLKIDLEVQRDVECDASIDELVEIYRFDELNQKCMIAPKGRTVVFMDLDETLVRRKSLFFLLSQEQRKKALAEFCQWGRDELKLHPTDLSWFEYCIEQAKDPGFRHSSWMSDMAFVEPSILSWIKQLRQEGALIFGLTARKPSVAERTQKSLDNLGIVFDQNRIFYTGNKRRKVFVIRELINSEGALTKAYLIDNSKVEIEACKRRGDPQIEPILYSGYSVHTQPLLDDPKIIRQDLWRLYQNCMKELNNPRF